MQQLPQQQQHSRNQSWSCNCSCSEEVATCFCTWPCNWQPATCCRIDNFARLEQAATVAVVVAAGVTVAVVNCQCSFFFVVVYFFFFLAFLLLPVGSRKAWFMQIAMNFHGLAWVQVPSGRLISIAGIFTYPRPYVAGVDKRIGSPILLSCWPLRRSACLFVLTVCHFDFMFSYISGCSLFFIGFSFIFGLLILLPAISGWRSLGKIIFHRTSHITRLPSHQLSICRSPCVDIFPVPSPQAPSNLHPHRSHFGGHCHRIPGHNVNPQFSGSSVLGGGLSIGCIAYALSLIA